MTASGDRAAEIGDTATHASMIKVEADGPRGVAVDPELDGRLAATAAAASGFMNQTRVEQFGDDVADGGRSQREFGCNLRSGGRVVQVDHLEYAGTVGVTRCSCRRGDRSEGDDQCVSRSLSQMR